jgi:hypothetical protein
MLAVRAPDVHDVCGRLVITEAVSYTAQHSLDDIDVVLAAVQMPHTPDVAQAMPGKDERPVSG